LNVRVKPRWSIARACLVTFAVAFVIAAIGPRYRAAWWLEHLATAVVLPIVVVLARRGLLSERSLVQLTIFGCLHLYGAHYTYANTPLGFALRDAFHLSRNHFDRIAHFGFGLLWLRPFRELAFPRPIGAARELSISCLIVGGVSLLYEQVEWITATIVDPGAGVAFLGTQGDVWDAQKDATAATLGSLVALLGERRARQP
jgi:putative membrane protein